MNKLALFLCLCVLSFLKAEEIPNRLIDTQSFRILLEPTLESREKNRLTEEEFVKAMASREYILLDARSEKNYKLRHIKGAVNLPFTEFTEESLAKVIPRKDSKVLIYCNNNFLSAPVSFASKRAPASLNLSTQMSLAAYEYKNIYELGPLLDVKTTKIEFSGTETESKK